MGEVGVHLDDPLGAAVEGDAEAGQVGGPEALLARRGGAPTIDSSGREAVGDLAGAVGRVVVDDQDPPRGGQLLEHGADDPLEVLGLVVGREDDPDVRRPGRRRSGTAAR